MVRVFQEPAARIDNLGEEVRVLWIEILQPRCAGSINNSLQIPARGVGVIDMRTVGEILPGNLAAIVVSEADRLPEAVYGAVDVALGVVAVFVGRSIHLRRCRQIALGIMVELSFAAECILQAH